MRFEHFVENAIRILFVLLSGIVLVLNFTAEHVDTLYHHAGDGRYNLICMVIGCVVLIVVSGVIAFLSGRKTSGSGKAVSQKSHMFTIGIPALGLLILFGYLIVSTHFYYFETGWDAGTVIWNAEMLADGNTADLSNDYYSIYPNNVVMTVLFSLIIRAGRLLPVGTDYYYLIVFQSLCMILSLILVHKTVPALGLSKPVAVLCDVVFLFLIVLSPWVALPYSDTIGMFVMIPVLYLYAVGKHPGILGFTIVLGAMMKPTVFIFAIALFLAGIPKFIKSVRDKEICKKIGLFILGMVIALLVSKCIVKLSGFNLDPEKSVSVAHYLMMGLNEDYRGVINVEDQDFSLGIESYDERVAANLEVAGRRFGEMWPGRLIFHFARKILYSLGDGTFAWGVEGQFFQYPVWTGNERMENFFRSFYYPGMGRFRLYKNTSQALWLGCILLSLIGTFIKRREKFSVLYLTVIGMIFFEMIFEPRARHLLLMAPIMCILASDAVMSIWNRMEQRKVK